ncbi:hypothetical protein, partial [Burkholderia sp. SCN-KJ]|uniref:hypothetical protein n=1 Tax=Burkholderia sp. SCN-KJ TaxID=2969248 RepID=UPI00214FB225
PKRRGFLHWRDGNVRRAWHELQLVLKGHTAADLNYRPAAIAEQSSLVTVTNGAEYRALSYLNGW